MSGMAVERGDGELVEAFRRGERAAFEALVERYVRLAGAIAYGIAGDYESAADIVQEAFLKVHAALADLREPERFKGWLYGVVRSTALDWVRKNRRRGGRTSLARVEEREEAAADVPGPREGMERRELEERVLREIQALPESYREVIVLKYLDERSYKEISETLGISIETIESRLFRARKILRGRLAGFAPFEVEAER
jgi:RNA polymerase sigma-70 factor (ECF subfamily)